MTIAKQEPVNLLLSYHLSVVTDTKSRTRVSPHRTHDLVSAFNYIKLVLC